MIKINYISMIQVRLCIKSLSIRVKTPVECSILIKKQNWSFRLKQRQILVNGEASFTSQQIFFVNERSLTFQIEVILRHQDRQKFGGKCTVNLSNEETDQFQEYQLPLQKSFDPKSRIKLGFKIKKSPQLMFKQDLLSSQQIDRQLDSQTIRQLRIQNELLKKQSLTKASELEKINRQKEKVQAEKSDLSKKYDQCLKESQRKVRWKDEQIQILKDQLQGQRIKFARMVDLMNAYGDPQLMEEMQNVMQQSPKF